MTCSDDVAHTLPRGLTVYKPKTKTRVPGARTQESQQHSGQQSRVAEPWPSPWGSMYRRQHGFCMWVPLGRRRRSQEPARRRPAWRRPRDSTRETRPRWVDGLPPAAARPSVSLSQTEVTGRLALAPSYASLSFTSALWDPRPPGPDGPFPPVALLPRTEACPGPSPGLFLGHETFFRHQPGPPEPYRQVCTPPSLLPPARSSAAFSCLILSLVKPALRPGRRCTPGPALLIHRGTRAQAPGAARAPPPNLLHGSSCSGCRETEQVRRDQTPFPRENIRSADLSPMPDTVLSSSHELAHLVFKTPRW